MYLIHKLDSGLWRVHINRLNQGQSIWKSCRSKRHRSGIRANRRNKKSLRKRMSINGFMRRYNHPGHTWFRGPSRWAQIRRRNGKAWRTRVAILRSEPAGATIHCVAGVGSLQRKRHVVGRNGYSLGGPHRRFYALQFLPRQAQRPQHGPFFAGRVGPDLQQAQQWPKGVFGPKRVVVDGVRQCVLQADCSEERGAFHRPAIGLGHFVERVGHSFCGE